MARSPVPSVAVDVNDARFDRPDFEGQGADYIICSIPRSGSTLLAYLLRDCGGMGVPHEYLHPTVHLPVLARRFQSIRQDGAVDLDLYLRSLRKRRSTANGVFGLKAHFNQLARLLHIPSVGRFFEGAQLIRIRRRDLIRQAISYYAADATGVWSTADAASLADLPPPDYNGVAISRYLSLISDEKRAGRGFWPIEVRQCWMCGTRIGVPRPIGVPLGVPSCRRPPCRRVRSEARRYAAPFRCSRRRVEAAILRGARGSRAGLGLATRAMTPSRFSASIMSSSDRRPRAQPRASMSACSAARSRSGRRISAWSSSAPAIRRSISCRWTESAGRRAAQPPGAEGRNVDHFALEIAPFDEAAFRAHLGAHGIAVEEVGRRYGAKGYGPSIYVADPDGNKVELKGPPEGS